jgi:hypothetical protein
MLAAALGWLGTIGTFVAYAMVWKGWLTSESRPYAALNMAGGLLGGTACVIYGAWPSAAANFAWAALGLHSMVAAYRGRRLGLRGDEVPASVRMAPETQVLAPGMAGAPLERAVPAQAVAKPHRNPGCALPQVP